MANRTIIELLGDQAGYYLEHTSNTVKKEDLHLPSPDHIEKIWVNSNRNNQVLRNFQALLDFLGYMPIDGGDFHDLNPNTIFDGGTY